MGGYVFKTPTFQSQALAFENPCVLMMFKIGLSQEPLEVTAYLGRP